jgi:hypothetical protein
MTFADIRTKLIKNSWMIVVVLIISNLSLLSKTSNSSYLASSTVGLNINNTQYTSLMTSSTNFAQNTYDNTQDDFSLYLSSRFAAPDIQNEIAQNAKIGAKVDTKKPFYEVKSQYAGFVNVTYTAGDIDEANRFNQAVNSVFEARIIGEWNKNRPQIFQVEVSDKNKGASSNSVVEVKPPLQNTLLPSIVGIVIGILVALALPVFSFKKKQGLDSPNNSQQA